MKIKIRKADQLYSQWLRRERPQCERCGNIQSLQVSHFYGRANENLRFSPVNTDCLCFACHQYFTANPLEYVEWKRKRMGEPEFKKLVLESNVYHKRDDVLIILWLMKELGEKPKEKKIKNCPHKLKPQYCAMCMPRKKKK